jgi:regulator of sigma E protease
MPAAEAGLQPGDKIIEIDGIGIRNFDDMRGLVVESPDKTLQFVLLRDGQQLTVDVTPQSQFNEQLQMNVGILGVKSMPVGEFNRLGPSSAVVAATSDAFHMSVMIVRGLGRAITGDMQKGEVGGTGADCGNIRNGSEPGHCAIYFINSGHLNQFGSD